MLVKIKLFVRTTLFILLFKRKIKLRTLTLYKDYFFEFYQRQKQKIKDKILRTFRIIETQKQNPTDYLKHTEGTDGLYEISVQQSSDIFCIFCTKN